MKPTVDRRSFIRTGLAAGVAWGVHGELKGEDAPASPNEKLRVGVMGVNGRGAHLARNFATHKQSTVVAICDVDSRALEKAVAMIADTQPHKPAAFSDFRHMLDDKSVDILVVATPNHWHAPATILGCSAGKHVYVEKPCSHTAREGELAIEAARKHNRVVNVGSQRRSWPALIEGMQKLHAGELGKLHYARTWYSARRGSIGKGKEVPVPSWLDYSLWQGPAPDRPYKDNLVHYNWHWHWHWGNGELGNNGIHCLDVARWGMGVDFPIRVTSAGGRYRYDDDQETPDTHLVTFDFANGSTISYEGLSWSSYGSANSSFGISFHGESGTMVILDSGYKILDDKNKEILDKSGPGGDADHFNDFLECVYTGKRPHADIEVAHKSTVLCHLGNIAHRCDRVLHINPENGHILNNDQAQWMWDREYRPGWQPQV